MCFLSSGPGLRGLQQLSAGAVAAALMTCSEPAWSEPLGENEADSVEEASSTSDVSRDLPPERTWSFSLYRNEDITSQSIPIYGEVFNTADYGGCGHTPDEVAIVLTETEQSN